MMQTNSTRNHYAIMIQSIISRALRLVGAALLVLALLFVLGACSDDSAPTSTPAPTPVQVVATTSIVVDWVEHIGGDHVEVFSIVPAGSDPHGFQPGARDVAKIADADLVLSVGLGLEGSWLTELVQNAARDSSSIVELGEAIDPIEFAEGHADEVELIEGISHAVHEAEEGELTPEAAIEEVKELLIAFEEAEAAEEGHEGEEGEEDEEEGPHADEAMEEEEEGHGEEPADVAGEIIERYESGELTVEEALEALEGLGEEGEEEHEDHGHGEEDPHFWFDPLRVKVAVDDIAARLSAMDPDRAAVYNANASAYNVRLDELHAWTLEQVEVVPEEHRLLLTSHDSLGYFANLYGFEVIGVILGVSTEREPSAEDLADLVDEVEEEGIPAVFGETTVSERLAGAVAEESGAKLVRLYSGALGGEGSGAETYIEMVRTNVSRIAEALR